MNHGQKFMDLYVLFSIRRFQRLLGINFAGCPSVVFGENSWPINCIQFQHQMSIKSMGLSGKGSEFKLNRYTFKFKNYEAQWLSYQ